MKRKLVEQKSREIENLLAENQTQTQFEKTPPLKKWNCFYELNNKTKLAIQRRFCFCFLASASQRFALVVCGRDEILSEDEEKLEARKMLENRAESHKSTARFVGRFLLSQTRWLKKTPQPKRWQDFTRKTTFNRDQKNTTNPNAK